MIAALAVAASLAAPSVQIWTEGPGLYRVEGSFETSAPQPVAWGVVTDYDGIGRFVSSIESSRAVRRADGAIILEQTGRGKLWLFSKRVTIRLIVVETPPDTVYFEQERPGDFDLYDGSWRIEPEGSGCRVSYRLTARPGRALGPRFAARKALAKSVIAQLAELQREIERRARHSAAQWAARGGSI